jgi:hypothetical protein
MRRYAPLVWAFVLSALAYQCLRVPTAFWTGLAWTTSAGFILTATLEAIFRRGRARSFWIGFLVFGCVYLILTFNHWPFEFVEGHLLTTRVFDEIYLARYPEPPPTLARTTMDTWDLSTQKPGQQDWNFYHGINQIHFRWAWHSLAALATGLTGGIIALGLRRPRAESNSEHDPRRGRRSSIAALLGVILVSGAALGALRAPCGLTLNLAFTLFAASLAWATLGAIVVDGRRRAFCAGFTLFGWPYLFAAYGQFDVRLLTYGWNPAHGYLPTSRLFGELYPLIHREPPDKGQSFDAWNPGYHRPTTLAGTYLYDLNRHYFIEIGHAISGLLVGMLGGMIGMRVYASGHASPSGERSSARPRSSPGPP